MNCEPENVDLYIEDQILKFLNEARIWQQIAGEEPLEGPIYDDPEVGSTNGYDIGETVATRILERREALGGEFTSLDQIEAIQGIGEDKMADLKWSFHPRRAGVWHLLPDAPVGAVHAALLNTGKVLMFHGHAERNLALHSTEWDPKTHTHETNTWLEGVVHANDVFCAHHVFLQDGRLLVNGGAFEQKGEGIKSTHIYSPSGNANGQKWERAADMCYDRWYPTSVLMPNGRVLTFSGWDRDQCIVDEVEEYNPETDKWTELDSDACKDLDIYPGMHLLPNGKVFYTGTRWADDKGEWDDDCIPKTAVFNRDNCKWSDVGHHFKWGKDKTEAMSVPLPPDNNRIAVFGGNREIAGRQMGSGFIEIIDFNDDNPKWELVGHSSRRRNCNVVLLPDSTVCLPAGIMGYKWDTPTETNPTRSPQPVYSVEIWDFNGQTKHTRGASMSVARHYHSCSLLLPDGRVLNLGSESITGAVSEFRKMEVYCPPYMFKGERPVINPDATPNAVSSNQAFTMECTQTDDISEVVLVRPMATTHHTDSEQRVVPLQFEHTSGNTLTVTAPNTTKPNIQCVKGFYMLFVLNGERVPSEAVFIKIE